MGTNDARRALRGRLPTRMYPWDRVRLVERAYRGHPHGTSPRTLAASLGVRLLVGRALGCGGECVSSDSAVIGHHTDPRVRALLQWHGLAHVLLTREAWEHDEGDAWLVTFELACPRREVAGDDDELSSRSWLPEDLLREWLPVARALGASQRASDAA